MPGTVVFFCMCAILDIVANDSGRGPSINSFTLFALCFRDSSESSVLLEVLT